MRGTMYVRVCNVIYRCCTTLYTRCTDKKREKKFKFIFFGRVIVVSSRPVCPLLQYTIYFSKLPRVCYTTIPIQVDGNIHASATTGALFPGSSPVAATVVSAGPAAAASPSTAAGFSPLLSLAKFQSLRQIGHELFVCNHR
jgi:hypothetical protein